jgi:hypothetical protein
MFDSLILYQNLLKIIVTAAEDTIINWFSAISLMGDLSKFIFSQTKIGDILTSLAIIISAFTLASNLSKDRLLRKKERADKIRNSAASTITKLDRWHELSLSIFHDVQPIFIDIIVMMSDNFDPVKTKNILWKEMTVANNEITWKILGENIQTASVELMGYRPDIRRVFESALMELQAAREDMFSNFIYDSQQAVLSFECRKEEYKTNDLWNKLRGTIMRNQLAFEERIKSPLTEISDLLLGLISKEDAELLAKG